MSRLNAIRWLLLIPILTSCSHPPKTSLKKMLTVDLKTSQEILHFAGTVQPLHETTLTSPVDGVLQEVHYPFGQHVHQGEVIFTLDSISLQKEYNNALTDYLKAKDNFAIATTKFSGTKDLWKAGLIAKNNYMSEKSNLNTIHVTLMQAWHALSELLEKTGDLGAHQLAQLNLAQFEKVQEALSTQHHVIQFKAPMSGVLLYPPLSSDVKSNHLSVGSTIKAGQALALIGDLEGIRIEIDIPEVDMDKITPGLPALIHGVAFKQQILNGTLTTMTSQASLSGSGTLPSFQAIVEVASLTPSQQAWIKAGMSANVELTITRSEEQRVPIAAIHLLHGEKYVTLQQPNGTLKEQLVETGPSTPDSVAILKGLKTGDVLLYD